MFCTPFVRYRRLTLSAQTSLIICFVLAGSILCSGCSYLESIELVVAQVGNNVVFDVPADKKSLTAALSDIVVSRIADADHGTQTPTKQSAAEVFWHVRMDTLVFKDHFFADWPIRYGQQIAHAAQNVPAKKLQPGRYRVHGSVVDYNGGFVSLRVEFLIDSDLKLRL